MPSSEVMHKWKAGSLHSGGPGGPVVHNQKQAVAIMESEKRKEAANGGTYPEGKAVKGYMGKSENFAQGGPVLPRTGDWKKTVQSRGFLDTPDRFTGGVRDQGGDRIKTAEDWGKGSSKSNPKAEDKSEKAIKPRG